MSSVKILPLSLLDRCIGENLWIVMKGKRQFAGTLRGFDDFFNMVLENVTEIWYEQQEKKSKQTEIILLNGHDIAYMVPGTRPTEKIEQRTLKSNNKNQE